MVGVSLSAGVEVDVASKDDLHHGLETLGRRLAPKPEDRSLRKTDFASGIMPASGPLLLDFGGPPSGALWVPLWVTLAGADDHTTVANSQFAVYLGGQASLAPPQATLLIPGGTAPQIPGYVQTGGKDTIFAHYGDSIFVLVYGAASGTNVSATLRYREVHPSNIEELNRLG